MFAHFRQTLEYAEIILKDLDLKSHKEAKRETYGYLFDISQLFDIYLEKLLAQGLNDWKVYGQEKIKLYQERFYGRNIYPDIVLKNNEKVIVLDAKFKKNDNEGPRSGSQRLLSDSYLYAVLWRESVIRWIDLSIVSLP